MKHAWVVLFLVACGDNLERVTPIDAAVDAPPPDVAPDGPCGSGRFITGELVDLDSSPSAFVGLIATLTQRGGTATDMTAPNGRFEMCASATTTYTFDVDVANASYLDAVAYIETDALTARTISFRSTTAARAASFYASRGLTYDPTKGHVLVFLGGDRTNLTMSGPTFGTVQCGNDDAVAGDVTWSTSCPGRYLLFPNVDATSGTADLVGDLSGGQHTVPVEAGKLTLVALAWFVGP